MTRFTTNRNNRYGFQIPPPPAAVSPSVLAQFPQGFNGFVPPEPQPAAMDNGGGDGSIGNAGPLLLAAAGQGAPLFGGVQQQSPDQPQQMQQPYGYQDTGPLFDNVMDQLNQLQQQAQSRPDALSDETRATLNQAVANMAKKFSMGETPAEKGMRIGNWLGANLLAPAIAAFGHGGTAMGAANMIGTLQQQAQQNRAEERQAMRDHMAAIQQYANLLSKADKADVGNFGNAIKTLAEARRLIGTQAGANTHNSAAFTNQAKADNLFAKTQTEDQMRQPKVDTETKRGGAYDALAGQRKAQTEQITKLTQPKVEATSALANQRNSAAGLSNAKTTTENQKRPGVVKAVNANADTAVQRTATEKEKTRAAGNLADVRATTNADKKGTAAKKGVQLDYSPNPTGGQAAGVPSPADAAKGLAAHLADVGGDVNHPRLKAQIDGLRQLYGPQADTIIKAAQLYHQKHGASK